MNRPALISSDMIWDLLKEIQNDIKYLKSRDVENNITELSLYKAAKYIKKSPQFLIEAVRQGRLKAMITLYKGGLKKYRFKISDLVQWQERRKEESKLHYNNLDYEQIKGWEKKYVEEFHSSKNKRSA